MNSNFFNRHNKLYEEYFKPKMLLQRKNPYYFNHSKCRKTQHKSNSNLINRSNKDGCTNTKTL